MNCLRLRESLTFLSFLFPYSFTHVRRLFLFLLSPLYFLHLGRFFMVLVAFIKVLCLSQTSSVTVVMTLLLTCCDPEGNGLLTPSAPALSWLRGLTPR